VVVASSTRAAVVAAPPSRCPLQPEALDLGRPRR
jgi:hypothetical protein